MPLIAVCDLSPGDTIRFATIEGSPRCWTVLSVRAFSVPECETIYLLELSCGERRASVTVREGVVFEVCKEEPRR